MPAWRDESDPIGLGYLLAVVEQAKDLHTLTAFIYGGDAYLVLRDSQGPAVHFKISEMFWDMAHHVMHTQPIMCDCWICQWRTKRKRFVSPDKSFGHVLYGYPEY